MANPLDTSNPTNFLNSVSDYLIGAGPKLKLHPYPAGGKGLVKDQSIPYLLEITMGPTTFHFIFPRGVENAKYQVQTRASVTRTQGGSFVDVIGTLPPKINISGTFGYIGTAGMDGNDGYTKSISFDEMIRSYYSTFQKYADGGQPIASSKMLFDGKQYPLNPATAATPMMRFYDFTMGEYYEIVVDTYALHRSTQRRMLYMYDLQMTAIKRVSSNSARDWILKYLNMYQGTQASTLSLLGKALALIQAVRNFLLAANRLVGTVKTMVEKVINAIKQITALIASAKDIVSALTCMPAAMAAEFKSAVNELIRELSSTSDTPPEHLVQLRVTARLSFSLVQATAANTNISSTDFTPTPNQMLFTNPQQANMVAVAKQPINDNDTIYSIAAKNGVDWKQIAIMNGLSAPFISTNFMDRFGPETSSTTLTTDTLSSATSINVASIAGINIGATLVINQSESATVYSINNNDIELTTPLQQDHTAGQAVGVYEYENKVLTTGDMITIPGAPGGTAGTVGDNFDDSLYWIDEILDTNGEMVADTDIKVTGGLSNLEMQLQHRLQTKRGELTELGHPEYGSSLNEFIGKINIEIWQLRALSECETVIQEDPRVASIANSRLRVDNTAIFFDGDVYPINQTAPIQISLPLA